MIQFIKPEEKHIQSYWETFGAICKEGIYLGALEPFPLESTIEFVKDNIAKNVPMLFVIDTKLDRCVGWCDAMPKTETVGYLGTGLLSEYRELGLGKKLITEIIELSKVYGYHQIDLEVRSANARAVHVYTKLGFRTTNIIKGGFILTEDATPEDLVQMSLSLPYR